MTCDGCGKTWVVPMDIPQPRFPFFCDACIKEPEPQKLPVSLRG
jgi:hypothetical protein